MCAQMGWRVWLHMCVSMFLSVCANVCVSEFCLFACVFVFVDVHMVFG